MRDTDVDSRKKVERELHLPHELWALSCELRGISVLLSNQTLTSSEDPCLDQALEGIGRLLVRSAGRLKAFSRVVDKNEVREASARNVRTRRRSQ